MSITLTYPTIQIDLMISRINARIALTERFSEAWEHLTGLRDELQDQHDLEMGKQLEAQEAAEAQFRTRRAPDRKWTLPEGTTGLRLCKMRGEELVLYEEIQFQTGIDGADTTLRRAEIGGKVGPVGETGDFWADIFNKDGDMIESIALDRNSWNSLKNKWMRCKVVR